MYKCVRSQVPATLSSKFEAKGFCVFTKGFCVFVNLFTMSYMYILASLYTQYFVECQDS